MPTIEISQETLDALRARVRDFGETPESVIRRLLTEWDDTGTVGPSAAPLEIESPIRHLIEERDFQHLNGRDRYFRILRHLNDKHGEAFIESACGLKFGKRIQIARSRDEIERSGKSTFPEQIPGTDIWALTNLSNRSKRDVVGVVMQRLGYASNEIRIAIQAIPDSASSRSGTDLFINNSP